MPRIRLDQRNLHANCCKDRDQLPATKLSKPTSLKAGERLSCNAALLGHINLLQGKLATPLGDLDSELMQGIHVEKVTRNRGRQLLMFTSSLASRA